MNVVQIDPRDPGAFDAWFAVLHVTDQENGHGWQRAERLAMALDDDGPEEHRCLVAQHDGEVLGIADLEMFRRENGHVARADVRVLPGCRRRGVGSAIVHELEQLALRNGRRELGGMDEVPVEGGDAAPVTGFARRHGFAPAQHMVRRSQRLPPDADRMRALQQQADETSKGYVMVSFADRWPDEHLDDRCELGRRMSTDVPLGEQELDEEGWDEVRVRQVEAAMAAQNRAKLTTVARHEASGRLVAFSEIAVPLGAPESVWQHDTLVMREHRGHRLGLATKLANTRALLEAYPQARTVSTWNAAENGHMIAINDAMGFAVVSRSTYWLKSLGVG